MGRFLFGFLRGQATPQPKASTIICGLSAKRKGREPSAGTSPKNHRTDTSGAHPVITIMLNLGGNKHQLRVLLDTGCSIALLNQQAVEKFGIKRKEHKQARSIENYMGVSVKGAGQFYTEPMLLQHWKHYSWEKFEISPMEADIDAFLPFEWISVHPPQGAWTNEEIRFTSAACLQKCTRYETNQFSLTWNDSVATNPDARLLGYV